MLPIRVHPPFRRRAAEQTQAKQTQQQAREQDDQPKALPVGPVASDQDLLVGGHEVGHRVEFHPGARAIPAGW